jgi:hypothetical protein
VTSRSLPRGSRGRRLYARLTSLPGLPRIADEG